MTQSVPREGSSNVGFRLTHVYLERLAQLADGAGMSYHSFARFLLIQALEQTEFHNVNDRMKKILDEVKALRADFHNAVATSDD